MAEYKLLLPSMGEGVMEATVIEWLFKEGDFVAEDDSVVEIATDKVDSDVPTPVSGKILKILVQKDGIAKVGEPIAILEIQGEETADRRNFCRAGSSTRTSTAGRKQSRRKYNPRIRNSCYFGSFYFYQCRWALSFAFGKIHYSRRKNHRSRVEADKRQRLGR